VGTGDAKECVAREDDMMKGDHCGMETRHALYRLHYNAGRREKVLLFCSVNDSVLTRAAD
jgi:hypothetical protein